MKKWILGVSILVALTGCSQDQVQEPATLNEETDNGLIAAPDVDKVLTASDVEVTDYYDFAYSSEVVEGYDTYKNVNPITVTADSGEILIYGSDLPIDSVSGMELVADLVVSSENATSGAITIDDSYTYFRITVSEPTHIVVAV